MLIAGVICSELFDLQAYLEEANEGPKWVKLRHWRSKLNVRCSPRSCLCDPAYRRAIAGPLGPESLRHGCEALIELTLSAYLPLLFAAPCRPGAAHFVPASLYLPLPHSARPQRSHAHAGDPHPDRMLAVISRGKKSWSQSNSQLFWTGFEGRSSRRNRRWT